MSLPHFTNVLRRTGNFIKKRMCQYKPFFWNIRFDGPIALPPRGGGSPPLAADGANSIQNIALERKLTRQNTCANLVRMSDFEFPEITARSDVLLSMHMYTHARIVRGSIAITHAGRIVATNSNSDIPTSVSRLLIFLYLVIMNHQGIWVRVIESWLLNLHLTPMRPRPIASECVAVTISSPKDTDRGGEFRKKPSRRPRHNSISLSMFTTR